tara:strand:+ start:389 stop:1171 length:783 start_codon:yes stop_codon:yes gene_type:complete
MHRKLIILIVAFHPSHDEVDNLLACLNDISPSVGYAVSVNDYIPGEPISRLFEKSDYYICSDDNPGYGRAINRLIALLDYNPEFIACLNTDLTWGKGTFESILSWINKHSDVNLICPQIYDKNGQLQYLCKQNPTLLGLFSRRFLPSFLKPSFIKRYDKWYTMQNYDYQSIIESPYLSGCCMVIRTSAFLSVGCFDERYFLYLEDADLTRKLSISGRCIHFPYASVTHNWGRGNYKNFKLMLVNVRSAFLYFRKWGLKLW